MKEMKHGSRLLMARPSVMYISGFEGSLYMYRYLKLAAPLAFLSLVACQTTDNMTFEKIGYSPDVDYAKAKCEIASMGVEQQVFAFGSPGYVAGAQLGNAIGNAIRKQEFMRNCMVLNGWRATAGAVDPDRRVDFRSNANKALTDNPYAAASK